ncbi:MAG: energy-coupling factor transporter ATPase [Firmicutes bacterium]|nr:energy-coupling factor transporter ATPase [Bacillota bacterium]
MSIILENVSYTYMPGTPYESTALQGINLTIGEHEILGIIGPTGSGKSTLVQHMNGLLKPTSGRVYLDGVSIGDLKGTELRRIRQQVGLVFQFPEQQLFEETVFNDIAFGPRNLGVDEAEVTERVKWAMKLVGLNYNDLHQRSPFGLSGGQMRRVAIAGVLAMRPKVLILDEPTAGLDPRGRDALLRQILALREQLGMTVIIVSHHMEEVACLTDRLVVMQAGQIILDGSPREVFSRPETLEQVGLDIPSVTRLMFRLRELGWPVNAGITQVKEASQEILQVVMKRGKSRC